MATSKFNTAANASILKDKQGRNEILHIAYRSLLSKQKLKEYYPDQPVESDKNVYTRISNRVRRYIKTYGIEMLDSYKFDESTLNVAQFIDMFLTEINKKVSEHIAEKTGKIARGEAVSISPVPEITMKQPRKANIITPAQRTALLATQPQPQSAQLSAPTVPITGVRRAASRSPQSSSPEQAAAPSRTDNQLAALMGRTGLTESVPTHISQAKQYVKKRTQTVTQQQQKQQMEIERRTAAKERQEAAKRATEEATRKAAAAAERFNKEKRERKKLRSEAKDAADNLADILGHIGIKI
jgi:hypothetical protein